MHNWPWIVQALPPAEEGEVTLLPFSRESRPGLPRWPVGGASPPPLPPAPEPRLQPRPVSQEVSSGNAQIRVHIY